MDAIGLLDTLTFKWKKRLFAMYLLSVFMQKGLYFLKVFYKVIVTLTHTTRSPDIGFSKMLRCAFISNELLVNLVSSILQRAQLSVVLVSVGLA